MKRTAILLLFLLLAAAAGCRTSVDATPAGASRLDVTPRHDEWIDVERPGRTVRAYGVYPQRSDRAPVVVLIHENRGLTDWVRTVADRLAEEGYIAVAPDFLSGMAPGGGGTREFASEDEARQAIGRLTAEQVRADLRSVVAEAKGIPAASGVISIAGFCWGGARAWEAANEIDGLRRVFVFYGTGPDDSAKVAGIEAPVFGFYGGNDARVNATIPRSEELMRAAGQRFEPVIYEGAGHAFMRLGEAADASDANRKAREAAWARWLDLLR
ncbi:MAG TPA: dienelactone hydrolase family protein [Thermoanaerobaculia bacterium]